MEGWSFPLTEIGESVDRTGLGGKKNQLTFRHSKFKLTMSHIRGEVKQQLDKTVFRSWEISGSFLFQRFLKSVKNPWAWFETT